MNKVLIILPSEYNKLETFLKELVTNLKKSNETKFYFVNNGGELGWGKLCSLFLLILNLRKVFVYYNLLKFENSFYNKLRNIYFNAQALSFQKLDIIHYSFSNLAVSNFVLGKVYNAKISIGFRGYDITYYPINHPNCYSVDFWNHIDYIQTNSNDLYQCSLRWGANVHIPVFKITAGVNDDFILNLKNFKCRENFLDNCISLLFIGRLHWKKGMESLIRLLLIGRKNNVMLKLIIIGDGPEIEKLNYLIWKYDLNNQIDLLGRLTQFEILDIIDKSDLVIAPSIQEGCSNVILESQARGKYCIVSNADGMNEVIEDGLTGSVCEEFDEELMFHEILRYSKLDRVIREDMAINSITRVSNKFSRTLQIEKWEYYFKYFITK
jgi:colanic acid/amylovoran biosynthesis glycosyltransferase